MNNHPADWLLLTVAALVIAAAAWLMWAPLHVTPMRIPPPAPVVHEPAPMPLRMPEPVEGAR